VRAFVAYLRDESVHHTTHTHAHTTAMDPPPHRHITFETAATAAAAAARMAGLAARDAPTEEVRPSDGENHARARELCGGEVDLLVVAVLSNDPAQVAAAIHSMSDRKVEMNRRMINGENALQLALRKQFTALVAPLLLAGAFIENRDNRGETALITQASANGDVFRLVWPYGAHVNAMALDGCTALHHAVHFGNRENVLNLLSQGADVHLRGPAPSDVSVYAMAAHTDTECGRMVAYFVEADLRVFGEKNNSHPAFE